VEFNLPWNNHITQDVRPSICSVIADVAFGQKSLETPGVDSTNWFRGSLVFLVFCKWLLHWTSLLTPGLFYVQRNMSEKEALLPTKRSFAIDAPSKVRNWTEAYHQIICAVKSQTALATFQNIGKTIKKGRYFNKNVFCSYFDKILYLF